MCSLFLYGTHPNYVGLEFEGDVNNPRYVATFDMYEYATIYDPRHVIHYTYKYATHQAEKLDQPIKYERCFFQFKWKWEEEPFVGVLYVSPTPEGESDHTLVVSARLNYEILFNDLNIWDPRAIGRADPTWLQDGLIMWEESHER